MNRREIKAQRIRLGLTQENVATELGMNVHTYRKKENGGSTFSEDEKLSLANVLHLCPEQLNDFLFDGKLPI
jgi:DNA-binding XRE family transcriptional regulator